MVQYHITSPRSTMLTNTCNIEDTVHDKDYQKFISIHIYRLLWWTFTCRNCHGCNNQLVIHASRTLGLIAVANLHSNMCITLAHVVVMNEPWKCMRNYGWLATTIKRTATNVKMVTHRTNCNKSGPWIVNLMPPLLVNNQEGMTPHCTH